MFSFSIKQELYKMIIRPVILYESKCWDLFKETLKDLYTQLKHEC